MLAQEGVLQLSAVPWSRWMMPKLLSVSLSGDTLPGPTSFHWGLLLSPSPMGRVRASTPFHTWSGDENFHYFSTVQLKSDCKLSQVFTEVMEVNKNPIQEFVYDLLSDVAHPRAHKIIYPEYLSGFLTVCMWQEHIVCRGCGIWA